MTVVFARETRFEVWLAASEYLMKNGDQMNVILDVTAPEREGRVGLAARTAIDRLYKKEGAHPLYTVAETIFPAWEYLHRGVDGVYGRYPKEYEALKTRRPQGWGTYAQRMVVGKNSKGEPINPLSVLVAKMRKIHQGKGAKYRACYEIAVLEGPLEIPLYSDSRDCNRYRDGPCLMHLSFKLLAGRVHLTALYRSHDYRYKVPGNLLGLARLQAFVATEVGANLGSLVVHSSLAYVDPGGGKGPFAELLKRSREALDRGDPSGLAAGLR